METTRPVVRRGMSPKPTRRDALLVLGLVFLGLILVGTIPRVVRWFQLNQRHHQLVTQVRTNEAIVVAQTPADNSLLLPGDTTAVQQIPLNARADGYLAQRYVDIGDHVKRGQVLAVIDTPELDQQVMQARADLSTQVANLKSAHANEEHFLGALHAATAQIAQARANEEYDQKEIQRYQMLATEGAVSWETRDTFLRQQRADAAALKTNIENEHAARSQLDAAHAQVKAAEQTVQSFIANLNRLVWLQSFRNVVAPYDGVITARFVDVGSLIASGGGGTQILAMGSLDELRIFVQVPQAAYRTMHQGDRADVIVPEFPDRVFPGVVTNVSGGLDRASRTLQVEVRVDNRQHVLPAGVYAQVRFRNGTAVSTVTLPVNAISSRATGQFVVKVVNGRAQYQKIEIFRDHGATVEVASGLKPGDVILLDPPDDMVQNEPVKPLIQQLSPTPG